MDIAKIAEDVLKEYNSEKEKNRKADFRKIISRHYKGGIFSGMSYANFFNAVSEECHKIQPGKRSMSKSFGDKLHKITLSTGTITDWQVQRDHNKKIRQLGGGRYEEGLEYYEKIMFE